LAREYGVVHNSPNSRRKADRLLGQDLFYQHWDAAEVADSLIKSVIIAGVGSDQNVIVDDNKLANGALN
jgi:hypothetical protein